MCVLKEKPIIKLLMPIYLSVYVSLLTGFPIETYIKAIKTMATKKG